MYILREVLVRERLAHTYAYATSYAVVCVCVGDMRMCVLREVLVRERLAHTYEYATSYATSYAARTERVCTLRAAGR